MNNINDLKDDDFTESMQGNEEGEMCIPCTIKDVNDGDFPGTANTMVTHSQNTIYFLYPTYHRFVSGCVKKKGIIFYID